jgi:PKD repeat protein
MRGPGPLSAVGLVLTATTLAAQQGPSPVAVPGPGATTVSEIGATTVSEIGGTTEAREGEGLAFGVAVSNARGIMDFAWDLGDGTTLSEPGRRAITHRYRQDGDYVVRVDISGPEGFSATRSLSVTIRNAPPLIHGVRFDEPVRPGRSTRFRAVATDPGDDDLTYAWDFGDGTAPVTGMDLDEPSHTYGEVGRFTATLTVTDDDDGRATLEFTVDVNPGFVGEWAGEVPRFMMAGQVGPSALSSGLGMVSAFSGAAPMSGGIADLSMLGVCLLNAGFWDDRTKSHVNFILTLPAGEAFQPKFYTIGWEHGDGGLAPGQLLINAQMLWMDPSYEKAKAGAENMSVFSASGLMSMITQGLAGELEAEPMGPGRNFTLTSNAGAVWIDRVLPDRIDGRMQAYFQGAWTEADRSGRVTYAQLEEASFAWDLSDDAQANLARCVELPFTIEAHTPEAEERNVDFTGPDVVVTFSQPFTPSTVTDRTIQVGYLNSSGTFQAVSGTLIPDADGRTVRFTPEEDLLDAVWYRIRVQGGEEGVKSAGGDALPEDYESRFATVVDLLERERGGG